MCAAFFLIPVTLFVLSDASGNFSDANLERLARASFAQGLTLQGRDLTSRQWFVRAGGLYEELRERGIHNADLYVNLAQSYFLAGDLAQAILICRVGLRYFPNDDTLPLLLADARNQVTYDIDGPFARPPSELWPPWLNRPTPFQWLVGFLLFFGAGCLGLTRWFMIRWTWLLATASCFLFLAFVCAGCAFWDNQLDISEHENPLIVLHGDRVYLHKGNSSNFPVYDAQERTWHEVAGGIPSSATALHSGVEARLRVDRGAWLQIELTGGEIGWVRRSQTVR